MRRLKPKRYGYVMLGSRILITRSQKQWLPSVRFSSFFYHSFALMVTAGMRTTSADISRDEQIHVATNSLVCRELGLDISPSLDKLRLATINWVMQPLGRSTDQIFRQKILAGF
jgi:hypothetical protein